MSGASQGAGRVVCTREGDSVTYKMPPPAAGTLLGSVLVPGGALAYYLFIFLNGGHDASHVHAASGPPPMVLTAVIAGIVVASIIWILVPTWTALTKPQLVRVRGGALEIVGPGVMRSGSWSAPLAKIENVQVGVASTTNNTRLPIILVWNDFVRIVTGDRRVELGRTLTKGERHWLIAEIQLRVQKAVGQIAIDTSGADEVVERTYGDGSDDTPVDPPAALASLGAGRVKCTRDGTTTTYRMPGPGANTVFGAVVLSGIAAGLGVMTVMAYLRHPNATAPNGSSPYTVLFITAAAIIGVMIWFVVLPTYVAATTPQLVRLTADAIEVVNPGLSRNGSWHAALADVRTVRPGSMSSPNSTVSPMLLVISGPVEVTASNGVVQFGKAMSGREQAWMVNEILARVPQQPGKGGDDGFGDDDSGNVVERTYRDL